jgi:thiamine biosynthesis lipoprotein
MSWRAAKLVCLALGGPVALGACRSQAEHDAPSPAAPEQSSASASSRAASAAVPAKIEFSKAAMGTTVTMVAFTTPELDDRAVRAAMDRALQEIERLEKLMSSWRDDSELAEINRRAGEPVTVSAETFAVVEKSLWAGRVSDGAFDVTFDALGGLWRFGDASDADPKPPAKAAVRKLLPLVDYEKVTLDRQSRSVRIGAGQRMGLGGIAKGYIVDRASDVLRRAGLGAFLVQAGGDLYGAGRKPDGAPWVSGIQDPRGPEGRYFATLELSDHAFSTAGDYARSYVHAGRRYHHIIDPETGFPATASRSVTVWAPNALLADAIDDAIFIMGPKTGLALAESLEGVGAVIVDRDNHVHVSQRLNGKVRMLREPSSGI